MYPKRFALLVELIKQRRAADAPLDAWVSAVGNIPLPFGGVFVDHMSVAKLEGDTPIAIHADRPSPALSSSEGMQSKSGNVHVLEGLRRFECRALRAWPTIIAGALRLRGVLCCQPEVRVVVHRLDIRTSRRQQLLQRQTGFERYPCLVEVLRHDRDCGRRRRDVEMTQ